MTFVTSGMSLAGSRQMVEFLSNPVDEGTKRRGTDTPVHRPPKPHGDGQGGMVCFDSWGRKESDMTE